ncbi:uncharacterized protein LOC124676094 [Lolium rigidum]|uniref:uncharacterized protein LOC124676094 n=1 Tax=Lolium rigidum TaxID=89674 RepID=UPI001F5CC8CC|nr:uncharacterized protein LOC124676094 [Lolium rigidum]
MALRDRQPRHARCRLHLLHVREPGRRPQGRRAHHSLDPARRVYFFITDGHLACGIPVGDLSGGMGRRRWSPGAVVAQLDSRMVLVDVRRMSDVLYGAENKSHSFLRRD